MSTQPAVVFDIPEEPPRKAEQPVVPRQSSLQDEQTTARIVMGADVHLLGQLLSQDVQQMGFDVLNAVVKRGVPAGGSITIFRIPPATLAPFAIINEIDALRAGKDEDEAVPTDFAYEAARAVVDSAYSLVETEGTIPRILPTPWATTDDAGGIRVIWNSGSKKLRANFGATPQLQTYLYHESETESDAEPLDPESLRSRIMWLTEH